MSKWWSLILGIALFLAAMRLIWIAGRDHRILAWHHKCNMIVFASVLLAVANLLCVLDFYFIGIVGGTGISGYVESNRFVVTNRGHETEVTEGMFEFTYWYTIGSLAALPVLPMVLIILKVVMGNWRHSNGTGPIK